MARASLNSGELDAPLRGSLISLCTYKAHIKGINPYYLVYNAFPLSSEGNICLVIVGVLVIALTKLLIFMNDTDQYFILVEIHGL